MSGYNNNSHETMKGFVSIMETKKLPRYDTSRLTPYICIYLSNMSINKRDQESINYDPKYKSLNARWFTKSDKTRTPMTDDIIEQGVIFELRDPDGSRSGTDKY